MQVIDINQTYEGIIVNGELSEDIECKYAVYIPKLMAHREFGLVPIWAKNEVVDYKYSRWMNPTTGEIESAGGYMPLHTGMRVNVRFRNESLGSAYIESTKSFYNKYSSRDDVYLINKTKNGSYIIQDDDRSITHIMHNNGKTNVTLDDDKVTLSVHETTGVAGDVILNGFEISSIGTKMKFGKNAIVLDDTGITLQVGDTSIKLSESDIQLESQGNIDIISEKRTQIKGNKLNLTGIENVNVYSIDTKITGNQLLNLNGNVVGIDSATSTHVKSSQYVMIESLIYMGLQSQLFDLSTTLNLNISSLTSATVSGLSLNLSGELTNIGSNSLNIDGIISHQMGVGLSSCKSMVASNKAIKVGCIAAGTSMSVALGLNSFVNGIVGAAMTSTLTGTAIPVGEIVKKIKPSYETGSDTLQKVTYAKESNDLYNKYVVDQFNFLKGNSHGII